MKKSLLLAMLGCGVLSATAQSSLHTVKTPFGKLRAGTWAALQPQLAHSNSAAKTTSVDERLRGIANYDNGGISDSLAMWYTGTHTSLLNNLTGTGYSIDDNPYPAGSGLSNNLTASGRQTYVQADSAYDYSSPTFVAHPRYYQYNSSMNIVSYSTGFFGELDSFYYDVNSRMTSQVMLTGTPSTSYSATNRVDFYYDGAGRPLRDSSFSEPDGSFSYAWQYQYDAAGNCSAISGAANTQYVYDAQNRLIVEIYTFVDPNGTYSYVDRDSLFYNSTTTPIPYLFSERGIYTPSGGAIDSALAKIHVYANTAQNRIDSAVQESFDNGAWETIEVDTYLYNTYNHMTAHHLVDPTGNNTPEDNYYYYEQYNTTGIANVAPLQATIYPNPTTGMVTINVPANTTAMLTGIDGRVLQQLANAKTIDLSSYAPGMYLLHLSNTAGSTTIKVVRK